MNVIPLRISDKSHTLIDPNLHDGRLLGIGLPSDGRVELMLADVSKKRYRIVLDGIVVFRAMDFREGNIILDVTVIQGKNIQIADLTSLGYDDKDKQRSEEYLLKLRVRVMQESLCVLELNPSYGCHLIGVAKNVSVFHDDDTK
jgi:hypothetical protein